MGRPWRVGCTAGNKPNASTAYQVGTVLTGYDDAIDQLASGARVRLLAQEVDADGNPAGAWEIYHSIFTDATPDTFARTHFIDSSTGSAIDWSTATGLDKTPQLIVLDDPAKVAGSHTTVSWSNNSYAARCYFDSGSFSTDVGTADTLYVWPMYFDLDVIATALRTSISSVTPSGNVRVGLYEARASDGLPGAVVADSGSMSFTTGTSAFVSASVTNVQLYAGRYYWGALVADVAPTWIAYNETIINGSGPQGYNVFSTYGPYLVNCCYKTFTFGALPANPMDSGTWTKDRHFDAISRKPILLVDW